jgi:hypothetical protein
MNSKTRRINIRIHDFKVNTISRLLLEIIPGFQVRHRENHSP